MVDCPRRCTGPAGMMKREERIRFLGPRIRAESLPANRFRCETSSVADAVGRGQPATTPQKSVNPDSSCSSFMNIPGSRMQQIIDLVQQVLGGLDLAQRRLGLALGQESGGAAAVIQGALVSLDSPGVPRCRGPGRSAIRPAGRNGRSGAGRPRSPPRRRPGPRRGRPAVAPIRPSVKHDPAAHGPCGPEPDPGLLRPPPAVWRQPGSAS